MLILFLLAVALLAVPVFADFGPKPQLTVRVENGPEELYYLNLLAEGALYMRLFRDCSKKRAVLYALAANFASFLLGLCLAEPVWKVVVDTML